MVTLSKEEEDQVFSLIAIAWRSREVVSEGMAFDLMALKSRIVESRKAAAANEEKKPEEVKQ